MGNAIPDSYSFYHYNPSVAAAVVFIIIFSSLTFLHLYLMIRTKTWHFIPFVLGGQSACFCCLSGFLSNTAQPKSLDTLAEFYPTTIPTARKPSERTSFKPRASS